MDFEIIRTGHLVYRVRDIEKAKHLWIDTLGFDISADNGRGMYFLSGDVAINDHMVAIRPGDPGERLPDPARQIGLVVMSYEVASFADLAEAWRRIGGLGLPVMGTAATGNRDAFTFADDDGNLFEFFTRREPEPAIPPAIGIDPVAERLAAAAARGPHPLSVTATGWMTLRSRDLDRARAFFEAVFGLTKTIHEPGGRVLLAHARNPDAPVVALMQAADTGAPGPDCKKMFGMDHFAFEVADFEALKAGLRHMKALGVAFDHIADRSDGDSLYFRDPDGNLLEFYYFQGRDTLPVTGRDPALSLQAYAASEGVAC